eukprot:g8539.t1
MKRVVVTGLGLLTPLGRGTDFVWSRLIRGESGLDRVRSFDVSDMPCQVAGQIPLGDTSGSFDPLSVMSEREVRRVDQFITYVLAASDDAFSDSGWVPKTDEEKARTGVLIGSGIGGLSEIYNNAVALKEKGPRRVSPYFIPGCLINLASGQASIRFGLKGPNHSVVTACATSAHAIGDAARLIQIGDADVMLAGGTEGSVCRLGLAGFAAMRALSTSFNDDPTASSRPWDRKRDGFVMGEGAGILVLEEYEHAKRRGAKIYAELAGYGLSGDAHHIVSPDPEGAGAYRAMQAALKNASIALEKIGYVNAHGTSTPVGDAIELCAIHKLFGAHTRHLKVSSTKSSIGHLLGAAGSVEAIFTILAMRHGLIPPTLNLEDCSEETDLDLVPLKAQEANDLVYGMSNSFGFGGTNASLIFHRVDRAD